MASTVTKKNSLCRYFIKYGDCFHGENCQFIHAYPPQTSPQPQSTPIDPLPQTPEPLRQQPPPVQTQLQPQQQDYNMSKLICSLKSGLPNEIDFAMQVATLLANTDNFTWYKDHPLVDAVCSSLHVFVCVCQGDTTTCYCYPRFWRRILSKYSSNKCLQAATIPQNTEPSYVNFEALRDHDMKNHLKIRKRIKTAAELIEQFSMTTVTPRQQTNETPTYNQIKKKKPEASPSLLKFVSLLLYCDDASFNIIGLNILSNTASKLSKILDTTSDPVCTKLVHMFQEHCIDNICLHDGDIFMVNRSIEVVSRLISSSSSIISLITDKNLVLRIEQFLTSHYDVTLFLSALECCYRISRHQPNLLTTGRARYLMKILVNLLNCDDSRYFSASALKKIKLVDEEGVTVQSLTPLIEPKVISQPQVRPPKPAPIKTVEPLKTIEHPKIVESTNVVEEYTCEWDNCKSKFSDAKQVYKHVFEVHIGPLSTDTLSSCLWSSPNGSGPGCTTKRPKYSLLTHLNDFHCGQLNCSQPVKPPEHPGYAPNAALLAIRRHANANMEGSKNLQLQSPLSISVRLTAALILRNLATESEEMKLALENHEPLLSEICMSSGRDEAKIIAECLSLFSKEK